MAAVVKDGESELPVPEVWRSTIEAIVGRMVAGDFEMVGAGSEVRRPSAEYAAALARAVAGYGDVTLCELPAACWDSSVSIWFDPRWDVLVDLFMNEEGRSDLVLFLSVYEVGGGFEFEIENLHVP